MRYGSRLWEGEAQEQPPPRAGEGVGVSDKLCILRQRSSFSTFVSRRLRGFFPGMGGSGPPGTRLGRHSPRGRMGSSSGATDRAGPGLGAARSFHQTTGRGGTTLSGEASGVDTSGLRLLPHMHFDPSGRLEPQTLRARMGAPHRRHMHMQCSASRPHWRPSPPYGAPRGLTWGHILTFVVRFPQYLEFALRPSKLMPGGGPGGGVGRAS